MEDNLQKTARVCRQGAGILARKIGSLGCPNRQESSTECMNDDDDEKANGLFHATVLNCRNEEKFDMLIPPPQVKVEHLNSNNSNGCERIMLPPAWSNILTVLLLALPPETWSWIKEMKLLQEINGLTSIDNLPPPLQEEVTIILCP